MNQKIMNNKKFLSNVKYAVFMLSIIGILGITTDYIRAASYEYGFDFTVTKPKDGESSHKTKLANYSRGAVSIDSMSVTNKNYEAFIERSSTGSNVTTFITFSAPTSGDLTYYQAADKNTSFNANLNITTALDTFQSCDMVGTWTPNAYLP